MKKKQMDVISFSSIIQYVLNKQFITNGRVYYKKCKIFLMKVFS